MLTSQTFDPRALLDILTGLPPDELATVLAGLTPGQLGSLTRDWRFHRRPQQAAPETAWLIWMMMGGRGSGKTRGGAEWITDRVVNSVENGTHRIAISGRASGDVRDVMIEGDSGLLEVADRRQVPCKYEPSKRRITWPKHDASGSLFSSVEPDQARGPQYHTGWSDELASWAQVIDSMGLDLWQNLMMGLRLGHDPRMVVTTTPRRTKRIKELVARATSGDPAVVLTRMATADNAANLSAAFINEVYTLYGNTALAAQELRGELLDEVEGALWSWLLIDRCTWDVNIKGGLPMTGMVAVGVDPPISSTGAECGIVVAGATIDALPGSNLPGVAVLDDRSTRGSPSHWAAAVWSAVLDWGADLIVYEDNQGGEMVRKVLTDHRPSQIISMVGVHAKDRKEIRAQPIVHLYEQGRVVHCKAMPELCEQMCTWVPGVDRESPDRLDALVYAILAVARRGGGALALPPKGRIDRGPSHNPRTDIAAPMLRPSHGLHGSTLPARR